MKHLTSIVAMNHEGAIGVSNHLPWRLKTDLAFFRHTTWDNVIILGRKTFESLGSKPLPGRYNVVLSRKSALRVESPQSAAAQTMADALAAAEKAAESGRGGSKECFVIGGATIYNQFAPFVDRYLITLVDKAVPDADTFFNLDLFSAEDWEISAHSKVEGDGVIDECDFSVFELSAVRPDEIRQAREDAIDAYLSKLPAQAHPSALRQKLFPERAAVHATL